MAEFEIKKFEELSRDELYALFQARTSVFAGEQGITYPDADGVDLYAVHIFKRDEDGKVVANLRLYFKEDEKDVAKIGRVLVDKSLRGTGIGKRLMKTAADFARDEMRAKEIYVEAQKQAEGFYAKCGFETVSGVFMEAGLPHVEMRNYLIKG